MGIAVTGGSVGFDDIVGIGGPASPFIRAGRESREVTRVGIIDWTDIDALLAELFPTPPALPGTLPGVTYLYANDVDIKAWPPSPPSVNCSGSFPIYEYAIVTITYQAIRYDPSDLIERRTSFSTDVMLLPGNSVEWEDNSETPQQEDVMAAKQIPMRDISLTFYRVPNASIGTVRASIDALVGHVNQSAYRGFAAQTLLFKGGEESQKVDSAGNTVWTINQGFQVRMVKDQGGVIRGWNHFYRNADATWQALRYKGTTTRMYPLASNAALDGLFTP